MFWLWTWNYPFSINKQLFWHLIFEPTVWSLFLSLTFIFSKLADVVYSNLFSLYQHGDDTKKAFVLHFLPAFIWEYLFISFNHGQKVCWMTQLNLILNIPMQIQNAPCPSLAIRKLMQAILLISLYLFNCYANLFRVMASSKLFCWQSIMLYVV